MSNRGFGLSKTVFLDSVKKFLDKDGRKTPFKDNRPGNKLYRYFISRNPKVKMCKARPLEKKRAKVRNKDVDGRVVQRVHF